MESHHTHTASTVAGKAIDRHISHDVTTVVDVGGLTEGRVGTTHIVVVAAQHDGTDLTLTDHLIELKGDPYPTLAVLVEDTCLRTDDESILLRITDPDIIVSILVASGGIDALHGGMVGRSQILRLATQADPAEGTVAKVEEQRTHDVLHIGWPDKALLVIDAILRDLLDTGIEDCLHEGVTVVKEVGSSRYERLDSLEVALQRKVNSALKFLPILLEHFGTLVEVKCYRAVATDIDCVAAGLVGEEVDVDILHYRILQQIDDVAVVGDRSGLLALHALSGHLEGLLLGLRYHLYPALLQALSDTGGIHLGDDGDSTGDICRLGLSSTHTPETGGDE